uniref:Uncharacterized protein n=1 Tax=Strombidium inclinatum TaxID=197538 RepID=A0A7S3IVA6_9SPIT
MRIKPYLENTLQELVEVHVELRSLELLVGVLLSHLHCNVSLAVIVCNSSHVQDIVVQKFLGDRISAWAQKHRFIFGGLVLKNELDTIIKDSSLQAVLRHELVVFLVL